MPIILPDTLPSAALLRHEDVDIVRKPRLRHPTVRVGLLNLMPDKIRTEMQFARLLGASDHQVELVLAVPAGYPSRHEDTRMYARWSSKSPPPDLDGLIVTGAPLEHLAFEDVTYWRNLVWLFDWATKNSCKTFCICWASFAALCLRHNVRAQLLPYKISGIFKQHVLEAKHPLMLGFPAKFPCPVSRYSEIHPQDVPWSKNLTCLVYSLESGLCLISNADHNAIYMFNHLEYEAETLKREYLRDRDCRAGINVPKSYFPNGDLSKIPPDNWRGAAEKLFANWLATLTIGAHPTVQLTRSAA